MRAMVIGSFVVLLLLSAIVALTKCGPLFPACNDPQHPCPPMPEPAPLGALAHDAGADR